MPISSADIAGMSASYTQQYMAQAQYASMVGQQGPYGMPTNPHIMGESMAGTAMNRGAAIGAPLATAGLALAGLDPFSLAIRGGVGAYGAGAGIGGAAMAGMAMAAPMAIGMAGVGYAGNQLMTGAQQVQGFNQNMRGSFAFSNPASFSGRGFGQNDLREIGSLVRNVASTGEQGFDELGRLAAQMGRMGMANGARNAKEFGDKFREMLDTVKTIAKEMNSTLEEAQTVMASLRGSGIFSKQGQVSQLIRQSAVAGGLATTEVTGMMNIGSQISRMYGGTGKQGALGGMESITQIGTAVQRGILSEEDIYNATGQTGAEGRRSLAMQQMEQSGRFLKSSKGRWFLASLAGKNGELDPGSIANWMGGGMGVEETRNQAHSNLRGVGRANFIRNEGRLRGAVMEQFGGLAPGMAMLQWAGQRGIDINEMDDRSMLFAQRQLGMGRDEADVAVRMARQLPELMRARRESTRDDSVVRDRLERQKMTGIEGVKRRFEQARNRVNNEIQRAGQDIMNDLSDTVSSWAHRLAGTYEDVGVQGLTEITTALERGGGGAANVLRTGGQIGSHIKALSSKHMTGAGGGALFDKSRQRELRGLKMAASMGDVGELGGSLGEFARGNRGMLMEQYANQMAGMGGEERITALNRLLSESSGGGAAAAEFHRMSQSERATALQRLERTIGIKEGSRADAMMGASPKRGIISDINNIFGGGSREDAGDGRTEMERNESVGKRLLGTSGKESLGDRVTGWMRAAGAGLMSSAVGIVPGAALIGASKFVGGAAESVFGDSGRAKAAGAFLKSQRGREMVFGMLAGSNEERQRANQTIVDLKARRGRGEEITKEEQAQLDVLERSKLAMDYQKVASAKNGKLSSEDWMSLRRSFAASQGKDVNDVSVEDVKGAIGAVGAEAHKEYERLLRAQSEELKGRGAEDAFALQAGGLAELSRKDGRLVITKTTRDQLMKQGGEGAVQLAEMAIAATGASQAGDVDAFRAASSDFHSRMAGSSVKELQAMARGMAGTQHGQMAAELLMQGRRMEGQIKRARRQGIRGDATGAAAVARELGIDLDKDQLQGLGGLGADEAAARLAALSGVGDNKEFTSNLTQAITAARGGKGQAAAGLLGRAIDVLPEEQRKKLLEAQRGGADPLEKLADKIGDGNKFLEQLVKGNTQLLTAVRGLKPPEDGERDES